MADQVLDMFLSYFLFCIVRFIGYTADVYTVSNPGRPRDANNDLYVTGQGICVLLLYPKVHCATIVMAMRAPVYGTGYTLVSVA